MIADRLLGLLMMMVLASAAILISDWHDAPPEIALLCHTILLATVGRVCRRGLLAVRAAADRRADSRLGGESAAGRRDGGDG